MKPWYKSKTVWFNFITVFGAMIASISEQDWVKQNPNILLVVGAAASFINLALRMVTNEPLGTGDSNGTTKAIAFIAAFSIMGIANAQAQTDTRPLIYYDLRYRETSAVALHKLAVIEDFCMIKGLDLDLSAFAGANTQTKKPVGGFALGREVLLARNLDAYLAGAVTVEDQKPISAGVILGISFKFDSK